MLTPNATAKNAPRSAALSTLYRRPPLDNFLDPQLDIDLAALNATSTGTPAGTVQTIEIGTMMIMCAVVIMAYTVTNVLRELFQMYQQKWHYLFETNSLLSWCLYISGSIMVAPVMNGGRIGDLHYSAASVTVFLSWFNLLLFLQRFDQVGLYVVMFLEILQTLIKVLTVFSILIIAFGMSFFILMSKVSFCWWMGGWVIGE